MTSLLGKLGTRSNGPVIESLCRGLGDCDEGVVHACARALEMMCQQHDEGVLCEIVAVIGSPHTVRWKPTHVNTCM